MPRGCASHVQRAAARGDLAETPHRAPGSIAEALRLGSVSVPALREEQLVTAKLLLSVGRFPGFAEKSGQEFGMGTHSTTRSWQCNPAQLSIVLLR